MLRKVGFGNTAGGQGAFFGDTFWAICSDPLKISPDPIIPNPEMLYLSWWPGSTIVQPNMTHLPLIRDEGPFVAA